MKIKDRIKEWLFGEELATIERHIQILQAKVTENGIKTRCVESKVDGVDSVLNKKMTEIEKISETMTEVLGTIEVAVDVHEFKPESWAVICVNGDPSYLKLVDLNSTDVRAISQFLRQFEYSHKSIDASPFLYKNYFREGGRH